MLQETLSDADGTDFTRMWRLSNLSPQSFGDCKLCIRFALGLRQYGACQDDSFDHLCGTQVIKRFIMHAKKTAFIVEHDFIMAAYLADRVIVYEGIPSKDAVARTPTTLMTGVDFLTASELSKDQNILLGVDLRHKHLQCHPEIV